MPHAIAVHRVEQADPRGPVPSADVDENGDVIFRTPRFMRMPGDRFEVTNQAEYDWLLENEAIVPADDMEAPL